MADGRSLRREQGRTELFAAAEACYEVGDPIEIAKLAADLGVSRASAYRWMGGNDRLLAEVLRVRNRRRFATLSEGYRGRVGRERVLSVLSDYVRASAESPSFRRLIKQQPVKVLEITTSPNYPNQRDLISLVQNLLDEESNRGFLALAIDSHTLAFSIVRLIEAFLFGDIVAGENPDLAKLDMILRLLVT
jgi:AcrR family transcriptional regulator